MTPSDKAKKILEEMFKEKLVREHKFHPIRKWRFDFAVPEFKLAFEVEGGIWTRGAHVNPSGFIKDCEKYNAATFLGWKVFRLPPALITEEYLIDLLTVVNE